MDFRNILNIEVSGHACKIAARRNLAVSGCAAAGSTFFRRHSAMFRTLRCPTFLPTRLVRLVPNLNHKMGMAQKYRSMCGIIWYHLSHILECLHWERGILQALAAVQRKSHLVVPWSWSSSATSWAFMSHLTMEWQTHANFPGKRQTMWFLHILYLFAIRPWFEYKKLTWTQQINLSVPHVYPSARKINPTNLSTSQNSNKTNKPWWFPELVEAKNYRKKKL